MAASQPKHDLRSVAARFQIHGDFREAAPCGSGHINDTYTVVFDQAGSPMRYVFQRINHNVFKDPAGLMGNVERVTAHIRRKLEAAGADQVSRRVLTLVPARDGKCWQADAEGNRSAEGMPDENDGSQTLFPDEGLHQGCLVLDGIGVVPRFC